MLVNSDSPSIVGSHMYMRLTVAIIRTPLPHGVTGPAGAATTGIRMEKYIHLQNKRPSHMIMMITRVQILLATTTLNNTTWHLGPESHTYKFERGNSAKLQLSAHGPPPNIAATECCPLESPKRNSTPPQVQRYSVVSASVALIPLIAKYIPVFCGRLAIRSRESGAISLIRLLTTMVLQVATPAYLWIGSRHFNQCMKPVVNFQAHSPLPVVSRTARLALNKGRGAPRNAVPTPALNDVLRTLTSPHGHPPSCFSFKLTVKLRVLIMIDKEHPSRSIKTSDLSRETLFKRVPQQSWLDTQIAPQPCLQVPRPVMPGLRSHSPFRPPQFHATCFWKFVHPVRTSSRDTSKERFSKYTDSCHRQVLVNHHFRQPSPILKLDWTFLSFESSELCTRSQDPATQVRPMGPPWRPADPYYLER
ncbi:hypothetical protein CC1G_13816 [Coprinopsis cinerea okayama7|uniref:Uncharacterized protein n=1 Tax=Coprinopsis cinerea (strain Okayama-7 / 130 / ATCC MYA-4618 / FGSC 9003) TaxID=240176 RepID=D6RKJ0_COPC7|nr:hypothetical protein CC1G_13816 [Coprinopsis cinerea okayama7\|eukprot:XP_002911781.1 hypothetical protein CC1G_13816 [Coprinopsis cinerea okayama7\